MKNLLFEGGELMMTLGPCAVSGRTDFSSAKSSFLLQPGARAPQELDD